MNKYIRFVLAIFFIALPKPILKSQIGDIKDLASGAAEIFSGCSASDISAGCNTFNGCWNAGYVIIDFLADHHRDILDMRNFNPCFVSLEVDAGFSSAFHYSDLDNMWYQYANMLPHIRGNLGIFSTDFRFNFLAEYNNGLPNSFKTWDLLFILNMVPDDAFRISLGSGMYYEVYTEKLYHEHYFQVQLGLFQNRDFIDFDTRIAPDYSTNLVPFMETALRYKFRFINFDHVYAWLSLGAVYQNYYQEHGIIGGNAGLILNIH